MEMMLFVGLLAALLLTLVAGAVGASYTLATQALERWGRYELCWDFDDEMPYPKIFWTQRGARKYLAELEDETEDVLYVCDRKTGKKI